jgi:hypothetical protein
MYFCIFVNYFMLVLTIDSLFNNYNYFFSRAVVRYAVTKKAKPLPLQRRLGGKEV